MFGSKMPIESRLLEGEPLKFKKCPKCGNEPFEQIMRGMVQRPKRKFWVGPKQDYCSIVCADCDEIVGHESPKRSRPPRPPGRPGPQRPISEAFFPGGFAQGRPPPPQGSGVSSLGGQDNRAFLKLVKFIDQDIKSRKANVKEQAEEPPKFGDVGKRELDL